MGFSLVTHSYSAPLWGGMEEANVDTSSRLIHRHCRLQHKVGWALKLPSHSFPASLAGALPHRQKSRKASAATGRRERKLVPSALPPPQNSCRDSARRAR